MSDRSSRRIRPTVVIVALLGAAALLVLVLSRGGSGTSGTNIASTSAPASETPNDPSTSTVPQRPDAPATTPGMPVQVMASSTENIAGGTVVELRAEPEGQSEVYGVEARLCRGDVAVLDDGMFTPTIGGVCTPTALAPDTDARIAEVGTAPYQGIDISFRVGVGTHSFLTQYNGETTITCGTSNPCQIVLKMQFPNGFGFRGIPVSFS